MFKKELWLAVLIPAHLAFVACTTDDDDSVGDDDDTASPIAIIDNNIAGVDDFFYQGTIFIEFSRTPDSATFTLKDDGGTTVATTVESDDEQYWIAPNAALDPNSDYTLTAEWGPCDGCPTDIAFSTSNHGETLADASILVDRTFDIDLAGATFVEPPGVGPILASQIGEIRVLFTITDESDFGAGTIEIVGAVGEESGGQIVVEACDETLPLTETQPASWNNPELQIGPADLTLSIQGITATIDQLYIGGTIKPDGSDMAGGTFSGTIDTRPLDGVLDEEGEKGAICELVEQTIGIGCENCASDNQPFCLSVLAEDIVANYVPGLSIAPRTCVDIICDPACAGDQANDYDEDGDGTFELCPAYVDAATSCPL